MSKINQPSHICAIDASTNSLAFAFYTYKKLTGYGKISKPYHLEEGKVVTRFP